MPTTRATKWLACQAVVVAAALGGGCGSSDGDLDPSDLAARDLLGLEPAVGARWDAGERAAARRVLSRALAGEPQPGDECDLAIGYGSTPAERVLATLEMHDHDLAEADRPPIMAARVEPREALRVIPLAADLDAILAQPGEPGATPPRLVGWQDWPELAARAPQVLAELAAVAGHPPGEELAVEAASRAPVAVAYLPEQRTLLVNPILLAALDPTEPAAASSGSVTPRVVVGAIPSVNPYNFYASLGDCAIDQQARCDDCVAAGRCDPVSDAASGLTECMTLAADPRGFALFCANLALAIITVAECVDSAAPSCPTVEGAGNQLQALQANAAVLDDPTCLAALNGCLAEIYGDGQASSADAGPTPPPSPRNQSCNNCEGDCKDDCDGDCDNDGDNDCSAQCDENGDSCTYNDCSCTNDEMGKNSCDCGGEQDSDCSCRNRDEMGNSSCTCGDGQDACTCTKDMSGEDKCSCGEPSGSTGGNEGRCSVVRPRRNIAPAVSLGVTIAWGLLPVAVLLVIRRRMRK